MFAASKTATSAGGTDPQFNYVTMLLHGDGTNGGQNNTFLDSSTNNFTITRNGNTTQGSFSPYGTLWSNYFDGTGDYLVTPANAAFTFGTGDFTIECWVNSKSTPSYGFVWSVSSQTPSLQRYATNNTVLYSIGGTVLIASSAAVFDGLWHHVAVVKLSGVTTLYVDGVSQGTTSDATSLTGNTFYVGSWPGAAGYELNGYVSNIRVVKGTALYTSNFTPSTTPLTAVSGTSLLTCQSNRFIDNSSNNFTITVNGDTRVQRFSPFAPSAAYSTATIGGSGYFDGSGDYLRLPASSQYVNDGSTNLTIEFWAYANTGGYYYLCDQGTGNKAAIAINFDPTGGYVYWYNGTNYMTATTPSTLKTPAKTWIHFAFVRNGGTCTIYVNGQSVDTGTNNYAFGINSTFDIGWYSAGSSAYDFPGYISNFRYVNGTAVYTSNFTPPTAPLSAITNTVFLLNMVNGAIFDNAIMNDLETVGNAQISTSVKKFGTGSISFDGSGDFLKFPKMGVFDYGTGNFTIECWLYPNANQASYSQIINKGSTEIFNFGFNPSSTTLHFYSGSFIITTTTALTVGAWSHVALVRNNGTLTIYINGTSAGSATWTNNVTDDYGHIGCAVAENNYFYNGYMDDMRITKGYARYTANFTPPTQAFPNN